MTWGPSLSLEMMNMLKSCWVVRAEMARSLVNADVAPRKSDEGAVFDRLAGLSDEQILAEQRVQERHPVVTNEVYEDGLKLMVRMADSGNEFSRFLSLGDLDEMVFGQRHDPPAMTHELALQFGQMLIHRSEPMTIAILDRDANLDEVKRFIEDRPDVLSGDGQGLSSIPKEDGR